MDRKEAIKKAGYTWMVSWEEVHKDYGVVTPSFPTTDDAIDMHLHNLRNDSKVFNLKYERI